MAVNNAEASLQTWFVLSPTLSLEQGQNIGRRKLRDDGGHSRRRQRRPRRRDLGPVNVLLLVVSGNTQQLLPEKLGDGEDSPEVT